MGVEENKAIVERFAQVWSAGNLHVVDELAAPDLVINYAGFPEEIHGPEAYKRFLNDGWYSAFPDVKTSVEELIAEGNMVASRWICRGTHHGAYAGIPPTGKPFQLNGMTICRVANGKVVEERGVGDALGMMQQLGVIPQAEQAPA
jgi:steroid delta-isomerase-like uncharacterized protein